jgi:hypothetical protein
METVLEGAKTDQVPTHCHEMARDWIRASKYIEECNRLIDCEREESERRVAGIKKRYEKVLPISMDIGKSTNRSVFNNMQEIGAGLHSLATAQFGGGLPIAIPDWDFDEQVDGIDKISQMTPAMAQEKLQNYWNKIASEFGGEAGKRLALQQLANRLAAHFHEVDVKACDWQIHFCREAFVGHDDRYRQDVSRWLGDVADFAMWQGNDQLPIDLVSKGARNHEFREPVMSRMRIDVTDDIQATLFKTKVVWCFPKDLFEQMWAFVAEYKNAEALS